MPNKASPIEERFREQYHDLEDTVLREIASGDLPWTESDHFLHEARLAARYVLLQRGAKNIPHVPRPNRTLRWPVVIVALVAAIGAAALYPSGTVPTEAEACDALKRLLSQEPFVNRHRLLINHCRLEDGAIVRVDACITLDERGIAGLQRSQDHNEFFQLQRFAPQPVPGKYCPKGGVVMAKVVSRSGRPWHIRLERAEP